jgi:hypothetical protein
MPDEIAAVIVRDARLFREASEELKRLLGVFPDLELTSEIGALVSDKFIRFVEIEVQPAAAELGWPSVYRMKPSELFLRLVSAARTGDINIVRCAVHELSVSGIGSRRNGQA